jgi:hypothetical protein
MTKRPSLVAGLSLGTAPAAQETSIDAETIAHMEQAETPKAAGRKGRPDIVHTSVYLPKAVHQKLREIAFHTDRKVHDIIMDGIDEALKRHGHPTTGALKEKR